MIKQHMGDFMTASPNEKQNIDNLILIECLIAETHQNKLKWTTTEIGKVCRMEATGEEGENYSFVISLHPDKNHYIFNLARKVKGIKVEAYPPHQSKEEWNEYDIEYDRPRIVKAYERLKEIVLDKTKREGTYDKVR